MTYGGHPNKKNKEEYEAYCGFCGEYRTGSQLETISGKVSCVFCHNQVRLKPNLSRSNNRRRHYQRRLIHAQ